MADLDLEMIKKLLRLELLKLPKTRERSGGTEISTICPKCGHLHPNSDGHLYVGMGNPRFPFSCKHCDFHGNLDPSTLSDIGVSNVELLELLRQLQGSNIEKYSGGKVMTRLPDLRYDMIVTNNDIKKIEYLNDRTTRDFSDITIRSRYKVFLNLGELIHHNHLRMSIDNDLLRELSIYGVGFVSSNNNTLNIRNLGSKKLPRYMNIKIDRQVEGPFMYTFNTKIDLFAKRPEIVLTEGAFDAICVEKRFYDGEKDDGSRIFIASGSSGSLKRSLIEVVRRTGWVNAKLTIFSDSDVEISFYKRSMYRIIKLLDTTVHFNSKGKDFGDMRETIHDVSQGV